MNCGSAELFYIQNFMKQAWAKTKIIWLSGHVQPRCIL